ncbi:hypothetical protein, partial [Nocardia sp. NPDC004722]
MTIGVATERGTVRAVALADAGDKLPERVVLERVVPIAGESKAELAAAVETAMEDIADKIGADREILGAAVAYRDAAERRCRTMSAMNRVTPDGIKYFFPRIHAARRR